MKKQSLVRSLILLSALLVLTSCKKDGSSATAADANADPVLLLEAGAEPQPLRFQWCPAFASTSCPGRRWPPTMA
jgi:hypothetical protein